MELIDLPWLDPTATAGDAVDKLIELNRFADVAAIVTEQDGEPTIIDAAAIIKAARESVLQKLRDIIPMARPMRMTSAAPERRPTALAPPLAHGFEQALDQQGVEFGVFETHGTVVRIVTRHEWLADP